MKLASALEATPEELCTGVTWDVKSQKYRYAK